MRRLLVLLAVLVVVFAGSATVPRSADATVPGAIGRIAFASDMDPVSMEIYVRDFAGGSPVRLTINTAWDGTPAWSPDGTKIAFTSDRDGNIEVYVMDADGTGQTNLTNNNHYDSGPAWSPDGSKIAFTSVRDGNAEVHVMDADGSNPTNLSNNAAWDGRPAWSPDGSKIAFTSTRDGGNYEVYVMDADGTGQTNLTTSTAADEDPAWSPDGSKIAFTSTRDGSGEVHVMDADGTGQTNLTNSPGSTESGPAWSPDGSKIAFASNLGGGALNIFMMDPDGSNAAYLTSNSANEYQVDWESVNRLPVAVDDGPFSVVSGGVLNGGSVLVNDTDPDGETLVANLVSGPAHGSGFTLGADGTFSYTHDGSTAVSDSFTYTARDTRSGVSNVAKVSITILAPPPIVGDTVGLVDPSSGVWRLRNGAGVVTSFYYGNPGDYPFVGDWDCDGTDTPGLYRQSDGFAYLRNANTVGVADTSFFFGNPGDVPIAGDFNNDGCDTLSIYRPANQRFYVINELGKDGGGLGAADYEFLFGNPGDSPVVGDWDGDGTDEIGLYRESSGFFYYRNTLSTGVADGEFFFGDPGDRFVAGDWGVVDGRETPGLFRPSDLTFFFRHTLTQGTADSQFTWTGADTDSIPVAGNFGLN